MVQFPHHNSYWDDVSEQQELVTRGVRTSVSEEAEMELRTQQTSLPTPLKLAKRSAGYNSIYFLFSLSFTTSLSRDVRFCSLIFLSAILESSLDFDWI